MWNEAIFKQIYNEYMSDMKICTPENVHVP